MVDALCCLGGRLRVGHITLDEFHDIGGTNLTSPSLGLSAPMVSAPAGATTQGG